MNELEASFIIIVIAGVILFYGNEWLNNVANFPAPVVHLQTRALLCTQINYIQKRHVTPLKVQLMDI